MSKTFLLKKDRFADFYKILDNSYDLYGPSQDKFKPIEKPQEIDLRGGRVLFGLKKIFFPPKETLFSYDDSGKVTDQLQVRRKAVIGVRACDLRGIKTMDLYFHDVDEPFYKENRENTFIVGVTCTTSLPSCFCTQFGGLDISNLPYDLWLTDIGSIYLVETGSEEGDSLVSQLKLRKAQKTHINEKESLIRRVEEEQGWKKIDDNKLFKSFSKGVNHPLWNDLAQRCYACGKCNMICPTCHCFDVVEEVDLDGSGDRVRVWDSCHLFRYGLVAGGHNFRGKRLARVQYRIYDKFYYPVERYGVFACVGCGRCLDVCNGDIDLRAVLKEISRGVRE